MFLTIVATIVVLLIIDAVAFDGRNRQAAWREAQTQANLFNYNLNRAMRISGRNCSQLSRSYQLQFIPWKDVAISNRRQCDALQPLAAVPAN